MEVQLNGKPFQADEKTTVSLLLEQLQLKPQLVVVELNRTILTAEQFSETELSQGDILEVVQFVGGG